MKQIFSLSFALIFISCSVLSAQTFEWAHKSGTSVISTGEAVASDEHGNSYVTGTFFGKCTFGDAALSADGRDIYIVKYDPQGNVLWARSAGGKADDFGNTLALDRDGNCYVGGSFALKIIFGKDTLTAKGMHDLFIAKYNPKGDVLWAKSAGGYYEDHAMTLSLDKKGNCYVAGYFKDTLHFTPEVMIIGKRISTYDMFLAKYDSKGNLQWAKTLGGSSYQTQNEGLSIATDPAGMSYLTGFYQSEAEFDSKKFTNHGTYALFVTKYDSDGKMVWIKTAGNDGSAVIGKGIALDKKGNCYVTGTLTSSAVFDTITGISKNLGFPDMFLAKYNPSGDVIWLRTSAGFGTKNPYAAAVDAEGNPYVFGTFRDTASFGKITLSGSGTENIFLVKYNTSGEAEWGKQVGRHGMILGKSLGIDKAGNVVMTGNFTDTADFGKAHLKALENTQDVFIAKLSPRQFAKEKKLAEIPALDFTFTSCELDPGSRIATVKFSIPRSSFVLLGVYDMMGTVAESFIEGQRDAGVYEVKLDLTSIKEGGEFYCRLQCGKEKQTKKMELKK